MSVLRFMVLRAGVQGLRVQSCASRFHAWIFGLLGLGFWAKILGSAMVQGAGFLVSCFGV